MVMQQRCQAPLDLIGTGPDDTVALVDGARRTTRGELREAIDDRLDQLDLRHRSSVLLSGDTSIEYVVTYLALLRGGHVPILAGCHTDRLIDTWRPDAVVTTSVNGIHVDHRRTAPRPMHPDLALLLSTSGTTGAPKLVRLSTSNVQSNAASIVDYLGLCSSDVGITTLPLHYCYGLSVLHSHLVAGAAMVVTSASVVDPCFARAMSEHGVTNVAGVPHTFELLDRSGPERIHVPTLRFVTQAGGRMEPERVRQWADRVEGWGARLFVMYGQTEATARMAFVPPELVRDHPDVIGFPIPGGSIEIQQLTTDVGIGSDARPDRGELVYRGPNVMMGYATSTTDLERGAELDELRTGDLAERCPATGMFRLIGRRSRLVKPFGLRIDLDELERQLRDEFADRCASDDLVVAGDDHSLVALAPAHVTDAVCRRVGEITSLPGHRIAAVAGPAPRTSSGKIDLGAILTSGRPDALDPPEPIDRPEPVTRPDVAAIYRQVLGCDRVRSSDSFVSLGGDSLSYVECSIRLEAALGALPHDWHLRPVGSFEVTSRRSLLGTVDTTIVLRALGILAVVSTHMHLRFLPGGAHLMLAVVGYNASRFVLDIEPVRERVRAAARSVARVAVPTMLWAATGAVLFGAYGTGTVLLVNNYVGPRSHAGDHWHFWFVEVFVHLTVVVTALTCVGALRRFERRHLWLAPLLVLAVAYVLRLDWATFGDWYNLRYRTHGVAQFFVLGWLVHRSNSTATRLVATAATALVVVGYFDLPQREWFIVGGLVLLVWCRQLVLPRVLVRPLAVVSAASLWIYITHFVIWPPLDDVLLREVAYPLTVLAGIGMFVIARRIEPVVIGAIGRVGRVSRGWHRSPARSHVRSHDRSVVRHRSAGGFRPIDQAGQAGAVVPQ